MSKLLLISLVLIVGCDDPSRMRSFKVTPGIHDIECYSGSKQIWSGHSKYAPSVNEGRVSFEDLSGKRLTITGECVITTQVEDKYE